MNDIEDYMYFRTACIAVVLIVISFGGCTAHQNYIDDMATVELMAKGANALEARCGIRGGPDCTILASRKP